MHTPTAIEDHTGQLHVQPHIFAVGERRVVKGRPPCIDHEIPDIAGEKHGDQRHGTERQRGLFHALDPWRRRLLAQDGVQRADGHHPERAAEHDRRGQRPRAGVPERYILQKLLTGRILGADHMVQHHAEAHQEPELQQPESRTHKPATGCDLCHVLRLLPLYA
jgi:hypothetical protein